MRRLSLGLEDLEPTPAVEPPMTDEAVVDGMEAADTAVMADVDAESDDLEEVEGIRDTVAETAEMVRGGADAKVLAPVLEHFRMRLGMTKRIVSMESMEAGGEKTAEELEAFVPRMDAAIQVAQEGFFTKLATTLEHMFRSYDSIEKKMHASVAKLEAKGVKEKNIDGDFSAAEIYRRIGKADIDGSDVVKLMKDLNDFTSKIGPFAKRAAEHYKVTTTLIAQSQTKDQNKVAERVRDEISKISQVTRECDSLIDEFEKEGLKKGVKLTLKPVDAATATKLANVTSMSKSLAAAEKMVEEIVDGFVNTWATQWSGSLAVQQAFHDAVQGCRRALYDAIWALAKIEKRVVYANYKYIQYSIK